MDIYGNLDAVLDLGSAAIGFGIFYLVLRVIRGLSFPLQQRAFRFFLLAAFLFLLSELVSGLDGLLVARVYGLIVDILDMLTIACVGMAAYYLSKSERDEISLLRRLADFDDLTGLANRAFFRRAAERRIQLSLDNGLYLGCIVLDIDDFKPYNDRHGHEAGNLALAMVAEILRDGVRADDIASRYGGEEFALLLSANPATTILISERLRSEIKRRCAPGHDGRLERRITASLGVAHLGGELRGFESLMQAADAEMYKAKRAGKNRVSVRAPG